MTVEKSIKLSLTSKLLVGLLTSIAFISLTGCSSSEPQSSTDDPGLIERIKPVVSLEDITAAPAEPVAAPKVEIKEMPEVVDAPVKTLAVGGEEPAATSTTHDIAAGAAAYKTACFACHDTGVAGAPKLGDAVAWGPRIATGFDALMHTALNGKGAMPAKGGAAHLTDAQIANVVAFMVSKAK